ncbi:MAG TPA: histidine kinase [Firmicutes bacterium]|jgi:signal transduction histidine kinase|nr:histidine kinase [Bacillota bacterium]
MTHQDSNDILAKEPLLKKFFEVGRALSSEKNTLTLLDLIICNSMELTFSDAATIYLVTEEKTGNLSFVEPHHYEGKLLKFAIAKNRSLLVGLEESVSEITPGSICGYTAITGVTLKIDDAYAIPPEAEYGLDQSFDRMTGYWTKSVLSIPMKTPEDKVMGVIQLINKKKHDVGKIGYHEKGFIQNIIPYDSADELVMNSLAGQAAVALENNLLYQNMQGLLQSYKQQNEQLEVMSRNVLKAHEEERNRIAREIHDGLAQSVTNLSLKVEICKEHLQRGNLEKVREILNGLNENIRASVQETRTIIYDIKPPYLDDGLIKALENHIHLFSENNGIHVKFSVLESDIPLEYYQASTIYRIVQEALTNIAKHADAQKVSVILACKNNNLLITIADDGKGFDPLLIADKYRNRTDGGFGLQSMRERIKLIKGKMNIHSQPGCGTQIILTIPFKK